MVRARKWLSLLLSPMLVLTMLGAVCPVYAAEEETGGADAETDEFTDGELADNDYILYFVNAGDETPETVEGNDKFGLYSSVTEQVYGPDPVTDKYWGLVTSATSTSIRDSATKEGTLRYYNGSQTRDKAIEYQFELPAGKYDLTFGFKNPWSGRSVNLIVDGTNLSGDYSIGEYDALTETTYRNNPFDGGIMSVRIQGPSTGTLTNYNDPLINYIIIRQSVIIPLSRLEQKLQAAKEEAANPDYTPYSLAELKEVIDDAEELLQTLRDEEADVGDADIQNRIRSAIAELDEAVAALVLNEPYDSFTPGTAWRDTNGALIQAHGGGIMYDERSATYYWYGEDKTYGYLPARGVRVYASKDLYNWEDQGLALTAIESLDDFENDPLISELYAGREDKEEILNDIGTDRIIERPKVIYNDKTGKYVMWMHTDGPTATSTANYAKAEAGYALSDSPTGPFVYQESNRMDRAPEDAEYNGQPDQPGMARDMNLFKDDDGTAYLIYSSEENMTIYISKLNESYTDVVGWHRDGNEERDTEYKAVYGEDYVRVFPGAQREAPAMFKYKGKYYMITSGATGWTPNVGKYTVADDIFGEWKTLREVAPGTSTTFSSQSTYVIPVDAEAGKLIYMGDRWVSSDLANSRYIWLPIEFGQDDEIVLRWYDEWTLDLLDSMGRITINTELPDHTVIGVMPDLPSELSITTSDGSTLHTAVTWDAETDAFNKPGIVTVTGALTGLAKTIQQQIYVVPDRPAYFVHAGGAATADYEAIAALMDENLLNENAIDQQYDPDNGLTWGYVGSGTNSSGTDSGDLFSSLRYLLSGQGDDLTYRFDSLEHEDYDVYVGLYDPWAQYSNGGRIADVLVNETAMTSGYVFSDSKDVLGYERILPQDGSIAVTIHRSANAASSSSDPQISWIMLVESAVRATGVTVSPAALSLKAGEGSQLSASVAPDNASDTRVLWSSSDDTIAKVDASGYVTALQAGSAIITAVTVDGGFAADSEVTVTAADDDSDGGSDGSSGGSGGSSSNHSNSGSGNTGSIEPGEASSGAGPSFSDTSGHWAQPFISLLAAKGIFGGYPDGSFRPDNRISRAEYMAVIYRMLELGAPAGTVSFTDVQTDSWYANEVGALAEAGIVTGYADGSFRPEQEITREEAFVILYRAVKERLSADSETAKGVSFSDTGELSAWAQEAAAALYEKGVIQGYGDGSIRPKQPITRAEIAAILAKVLE